jgi:hypothetical protein
MGETFVDVVGGDFQGIHGGIFYPMAGKEVASIPTSSGVAQWLLRWHETYIRPFVLITSDLAIVF